MKDASSAKPHDLSSYHESLQPGRARDGSVSNKYNPSAKVGLERVVYRGSYRVWGLGSKLLKVGYISDYIGVVVGDTRSLDYVPDGLFSTLWAPFGNRLY